MDSIDTVTATNVLSMLGPFGARARRALPCAGSASELAKLMPAAALRYPGGFGGEGSKVAQTAAAERGVLSRK